MLQLKKAVENSSAHGLPRAATGDKPMYVRVAWLLLFLLFLCLFARGLVGFVIKLQSRKVTSSLEASSVRFKFPDVYACFESPVSGTYAASMSADTAREMEARLNETEANFGLCYQKLLRRYEKNKKDMEDMEGLSEKSFKNEISSYYPGSLPYRLLVDALAHRAEQSVISSDLSFMSDEGSPEVEKTEFTSFYHPNYLRCFRWSLAPPAEQKLLRGGTSAGLALSLLLDVNATEQLVPASGHTVATRVFLRRKTDTDDTVTWRPVHLSDWSLFNHEQSQADRGSGIRVFLTPPGEYPTDFTKSYLLAPGKFHLMELSMIEQQFKKEDSECIENPPSVQFLNMYDQAPYTHEYSFSYCYYYEYHKRWQAQLVNYSGPASPLPWPLSHKKCYLNFSGPAEEVTELQTDCGENATDVPDEIKLQDAQTACQGRDRCNRLQYDATISSADWPSPSSLSTYLDIIVANARASAQKLGLPVPALDFLATASSADAAAYVRSNLLKLQIRPSRVMCDRLIYAIEYGPENFIADIGGILGIYLGMSLLTVCELIEVIVDVARFGFGGERQSEVRGERPRTTKVDP